MQNLLFPGKLQYKKNVNLKIRQYNVKVPADFDEEVYLKLNPDVDSHKKLNPKLSGKLHYKKYGYFENRQYNVKVSADFDLDLSKENFSNENESILNFNEIKFIDLDNKYIKINNIDLIKSFILIVDFPKWGGGTNVFLNTIIRKYKYKQTFLIIRNFDGIIKISINDDYELNSYFNENESILFLQQNKDKIIKIFVNHTITHSVYFLNSLFNFGKEVSTITHDYYYLSDKPQPYWDDLIKITNIPNNKIDINKFDKVICQNVKVSNVFDKILKRKNIIISPLPDFKNSLNTIDTNNSTIIIAVIGELSSIKGKEKVEEINNYIQTHNLNMKVIVIGCTNGDVNNLEYYRYSSINEFNDLITRYKPNIILETSIWPETYSYTLSLSMITNLPILSLKKNYDGVISNRLLNYEKKYFFETIPEFISLVNQHSQQFLYTIEPKIYYNSFWDDYFISNKNKKKNNLTSFKYGIKPYFIYFPQFHEIEENNKNFYKDFSDINNLYLLNKSKISDDIETPFLKELNLNNLCEYNLENSSLIQKHIDIIQNYGYPGFAIYYYWFSNNSITNKNMIMEKVINIFFSENVNLRNKKVFFIWANEDWSKNEAFGNTSQIVIENIYSHKNIIKNVNNLMIFFKHENYLKIDNKPVFFIYHPWFLNEIEIANLYNTLEIECKINGFNGVHFVLNNMIKNYSNYNQFAIHFNYKNNSMEYKKTQIILNYSKYLNNEETFKDCIQTIAFDFDNRARLFKPNKLSKSTICEENTEVNKIFYMNKVLEKYKKEKKTELENILLINAFNEWGEKMTFEPSTQYEYYNLNLLTDYLTN